VFTVEQRERARERILELAKADPRVVGGAAVGSLATGPGDRWSDLDLTFGVADGVELGDVLEDLTRKVIDELEAVVLFDLPFESTIYRVFLLPGALQVDLSFTPASDFGARGPRWKLLFGEEIQREHTPPPSAREIFGYAVHEAVRARFCIERGRLWQAVYLIDDLRDHAFALASLRRGLEAAFARGIHELPEEVQASFEDTLVLSLEPEELLRALRSAIGALQREAVDASDLVEKLEPHLREIQA
jgi:predicted nucleotidyltransferase